MPSVTPQKKQDTVVKIYEMLGKYKQILVVTLENVGSHQIQQIRKTISLGGGILVVGKNTVIRKAIQFRLEEVPKVDSRDPNYAQFSEFRRIGGEVIPELKTLLDEIKGKVGLVFTNEPVFDLKPKIEANRIQASAKVGGIAPINVTIPPGPTGMDPSQIQFFHALQMSTKIQKGQIEITKEFPVCVAGKKVGNSEVALLQKMNIKPFQYGMDVLCCYDDGAILSREVISINLDSILDSFKTGINYIAAASVEIGEVNALTIGSLIQTAFKNLAAIGLETDYKFKQLANANSAPSAPAAKVEAKVEKKEEKKAEVKKEEPKEEPEEDFEMGGMFD